MNPLASLKILPIFALPTHIVSSVNHRIYRILNTHRRSFLYSYCTTAISGFGDFEKATLSLFLTKIKFFTNAKPSKKLHPREVQYLGSNGYPTTRGRAFYFSFFRLFLRGVFPVLPAAQCQSHTHLHGKAKPRNPHTAFHRQEKSLLRAWQYLRKSSTKALGRYAAPNTHLLANSQPLKNSY